MSTKRKKYENKGAKKGRPKPIGSGKKATGRVRTENFGIKLTKYRCNFKNIKISKKKT